MSDTQWQELDGDPNTVESKGRTYTELAEAISRSVGALQQIVDDTDTTAKSMDKTRKLAGDVREDIEKARERYAHTGEALTTYGAALRAAKNEADPAAQRLRTLRDELAAAETTAARAETDVDGLPNDASEADKNDANRSKTNANNAVSDLQGDITQAENEWNSGHGDKDTAARNAISKIEEVVSGSKVHGLEDGFWDEVGKVWDSVYKVVKVICDIAGILAIFLSWVPILGQILVVLAAVGAILAVIDATINALSGNGSWWAVVGAGAMAALTLFGGKAVGALAKYAKGRTVVNTAHTLGSTQATTRFGSAVLRESENVVAMSKMERMTSLLKSPFVRSADDAARMSAFQSSKSFSTFMAQTGQAAKGAFPNPFKDWGLRAITGNADVVDLAKLARESDVVIDAGSKVAGGLAIVGAGAMQINNIATHGGALDHAVGRGDGQGIAASSNSLVGATNNAPWSKITGSGINYLLN